MSVLLYFVIPSLYIISAFLVYGYMTEREHEEPGSAFGLAILWPVLIPLFMFCVAIAEAAKFIARKFDKAARWVFTPRKKKVKLPKMKVL